MRTSHRCRSKTLKKFARASDHNSKSQSPQAAAHQVHTNQTGHQEIYIPGTGFSDSFLSDRDHILRSFGTLQNIIHYESGSTTLGPGWIKTYGVGIVSGFYDYRHLPASQCPCSLVRSQYGWDNFRRLSEPI